MPRLQTPGPGAYEAPSHLLIGSPGAKGKQTAAFKSNSKRVGKVETDTAGDPGQYDLDRAGVHLGRKEPMSARTGRSFNRDAGSGRASFGSNTSRPTSAPPRSARGGPGEHDYSHLYSCGNTSPQMTSSFLSAMPLGGHVRKSDTPGVGVYDPHKKSGLTKSFSKDGSSMFAGAKSARGGSARSATSESVGPGSYELDRGSISQNALSSTNTRLPGFASSTVRSFGSGSRSTSPAPGSYDADARESLSARSTRSFNTAASKGMASFSTTSKRQGREAQSSAAGLDPGQYTVEHPGVHTGKAESLSARSTRSFNRDAGKGRGSFGSTTKRSGKAGARSARGGPGEHDYSHLYSCGNTSPQMTSSFLSAMPLGGHVRKSDTPGVGVYDPHAAEDMAKNIKGGSSAFSGASGGRGRSARSATSESVGPGSYELDRGSIKQRVESTKNPRLPGFASSTVRSFGAA